MSAGSPASTPAKSRVVEAVCILLCQKYRQSRREVDSGKVTYKSRWKLIISEYNSVRARLLNSPVLEETNLMLCSINETTLIKWFKNEVRRDEITLLMQGLTPPQQPLCANESLPPARKLPSSPGPPPVNPHIITEPEDTTEQSDLGSVGNCPHLACLASTLHLLPVLLSL